MPKNRPTTEPVKDRRLKVLFNSNAVHTNSGYAVEQRDLLFRLVRDGWNVAQIGFWGIEGYPVYLCGEDVIDERFKGLKLKVYPKMGDAWGADAMYHHAKDFEANVVSSMQDIWTLNPDFLQKIAQEGRKFVPWVPIDKDPCPPGVLDKMRYAYRILTFSRFGQKTIQKEGFASKLILEGTDTEIMKPADKMEMRKKLGIKPDLFVFGMIAANKENPPRKGFQEAMEAFKLFHDKHPEATLLIHSHQQNPGGGFPIQEFARHLGYLDRVIFTNDYRAIYGADSWRIAEEMNALDVLLHPSQTEGFGLTVVEAMSCGVPAIVNRTTSMPELVVDGVTGMICETGWKRWTNDNSWVHAADPKSLYGKMEELFTLLKEKPQETAKACRDHVIQNYNIETTAALWTEELEKLQREILPPLEPVATAG